MIGKTLIKVGKCMTNLEARAKARVLETVAKIKSVIPVIKVRIAKPNSSQSPGKLASHGISDNVVELSVGPKAFTRRPSGHDVALELEGKPVVQSAPNLEAADTADLRNEILKEARQTQLSRNERSSVSDRGQLFFDRNNIQKRFRRSVPKPVDRDFVHDSTEAAESSAEDHEAGGVFIWVEDCPPASHQQQEEIEEAVILGDVTGVETSSTSVSSGCDGGQSAMQADTHRRGGSRRPGNNKQEDLPSAHPSVEALVRTSILHEIGTASRCPDPVEMERLSPATGSDPPSALQRISGPCVFRVPSSSSADSEEREGCTSVPQAIHRTSSQPFGMVQHALKVTRCDTISKGRRLLSPDGVSIEPGYSNQELKQWHNVPSVTIVEQSYAGPDSSVGRYRDRQPGQHAAQGQSRKLIPADFASASSPPDVLVPKPVTQPALCMQRHGGASDERKAGQPVSNERHDASTQTAELEVNGHACSITSSKHQPWNAKACGHPVRRSWDRSIFRPRDLLPTGIDLPAGAQAAVAVYRHRESNELFVCKRAQYSARVRYAGTYDLAEAYILSEVLGRHDNVVKLMHSLWSREIPGLHNRLRILYFEYCDGGDLLRFSSNMETSGREMPDSFLAHILSGLCAAMTWLHSGKRKTYDERLEEMVWRKDSGWKGSVFHRDVKPENVLLRWSTSNQSGYPEVVLADFGLACEAHHNLDCAGTPGYWAPEVEAVFQKYSQERLTAPCHTGSEAADIYSIGATMYMLMTRSCKSYGWDITVQIRDRRAVVKAEGGIEVSGAVQLWHCIETMLRTDVQRRTPSCALPNISDMAGRQSQLWHKQDPHIWPKWGVQVDVTQAERQVYMQQKKRQQTNGHDVAPPFRQAQTSQAQTKAKECAQARQVQRPIDRPVLAAARPGKAAIAGVIANTPRPEVEPAAALLTNLAGYESAAHNLRLTPHDLLAMLKRSPVPAEVEFLKRRPGEPEPILPGLGMDYLRSLVREYGPIAAAPEAKHPALR